VSESSGGPAIGADEWVARSGERAERHGGLTGRAQALYGRVPKPAVFAFFVILAVLVPVFTAQTDNDIYFLRVCTIALVFALLALGLNVAVGFAGLLDLGYIAYYGIGAYGYAMLSSDKHGIHWEAWLVIPLVVAISALLGLLLALPSRRLVGDYLAIVTLFFSQIFYIIATQGYRIWFLGLNSDLGFDWANRDSPAARTGSRT
jgi:ABC-type branched-subunit amino acid transport system permease subunit